MTIPPQFSLKKQKVEGTVPYGNPSHSQSPAQVKEICEMTTFIPPDMSSIIGVLPQDLKLEHFERPQLGFAPIGPKRFKCPRCPQRFQTSAMLHPHLKKHEDYLVCVHCKKKLSCIASLVSHVYTHTGEKPWKCVLCPKKFTTKFNLKIHILSCQKSKNQKLSSEELRILFGEHVQFKPRVYVSKKRRVAGSISPKNAHEENLLIAGSIPMSDGKRKKRRRRIRKKRTKKERKAKIEIGTLPHPPEMWNLPALDNMGFPLCPPGVPPEQFQSYMDTFQVNLDNSMAEPIVQVKSEPLPSPKRKKRKKNIKPQVISSNAPALTPPLMLNDQDLGFKSIYSPDKNGTPQPDDLPPLQTVLPNISSSLPLLEVQLPEVSVHDTSLNIETEELGKRQPIFNMAMPGGWHTPMTLSNFPSNPMSVETSGPAQHDFRSPKSRRSSPQMNMMVSICRAMGSGLSPNSRIFGSSALSSLFAWQLDAYHIMLELTKVDIEQRFSSPMDPLNYSSLNTALLSENYVSFTRWEEDLIRIWDSAEKTAKPGADWLAVSALVQKSRQILTYRKTEALILPHLRQSVSPVLDALLSQHNARKHFWKSSKSLDFETILANLAEGRYLTFDQWAEAVKKVWSPLLGATMGTNPRENQKIQLAQKLEQTFKHEMSIPESARAVKTPSGLSRWWQWNNVRDSHYFEQSLTRTFLPHSTSSSRHESPKSTWTNSSTPKNHERRSIASMLGALEQPRMEGHNPGFINSVVAEWNQFLSRFQLQTTQPQMDVLTLQTQISDLLKEPSPRQKLMHIYCCPEKAINKLTNALNKPQPYISPDLLPIAVRAVSVVAHKQLYGFKGAITISRNNCCIWPGSLAYIGKQVRTQPQHVLDPDSYFVMTISDRAVVNPTCR